MAMRRPRSTFLSDPQGLYYADVKFRFQPPKASFAIWLSKHECFGAWSHTTTHRMYNAVRKSTNLLPNQHKVGVGLNYFLCMFGFPSVKTWCALWPCIGNLNICLKAVKNIYIYIPLQCILYFNSYAPWKHMNPSSSYVLQNILPIYSTYTSINTFLSFCKKEKKSLGHPCGSNFLNYSDIKLKRTLQ